MILLGLDRGVGRFSNLGGHYASRALFIKEEGQFLKGKGHFIVFFKLFGGTCLLCSLGSLKSLTRGPFLKLGLMPNVCMESSFWHSIAISNMNKSDKFFSIQILYDV